MIRILDKHVADKIAAGEVIDRPVSIIKELVENSLDAEADAITIEIKDGGKSYIRVTDNGMGIPSNQVELAFKRHATSKITIAEDLDAIETLGFRGEALASICAVSKVELITKTRDEKMGRHLIIEGSDVISNSPIGCPDGTTITVRNLFYNVPARCKFLASDSGETRRIVDMVSKIALSYVDVKFTLINGSKTVFSTMGRGNILNTIINIYGSESSSNLIPLDYKRDRYLVKGYISVPSHSSPSRSKQIFCVNGRVVKSNVIERALDIGYKEKLFAGRYPIAYLFIYMPPEKLDVNVHPTKKEVRFDDPFEVSDFIVEAIKAALNVKAAIPEIKIQEKSKIVEEVNISPLEYKSPQKENVDGIQSEVDINKLLSSIRADEDLKKVEPISSEDKTINDDVDDGKLEIKKSSTEPFDFNELEQIGLLFNTYIIAKDMDNMYLIDQHAAHERVFYEKLLNQYNSEDKLRQTLLLPLSISVSVEVTAIEEAWIKQVNEIGYDIEYFGNNTYLVREIPAFMTLKEAELFLSDLFKEINDKPDLTNKNTVSKIITNSCKSAVKGGDALKPEEIEALLVELKACINPFSCPHGRPTFIRMTKKEIERLFKRI